MRRRSFFVASAAAGLSIYARGGEHRSTERGDIPKRVFGKTGERLTIVGQAGGRFPLCGYEDAKAVTLRAYELGVNYFDNARIYWEGKSEQVYGEVLAPFRKHIFLTTKSPQRSRQGAEADLEKSLRALNTDYVDLWQIHQVSTMDEVEQIFAPGGAIGAFEAAKKAGKCRFYGLYGPPRPRGSSGDAEKVRQVRLNSDASEPCRPCISELREERPARGTRTAYGYSGHEEYREREVASGHFSEGLFVLRPQFAHSLSGSWLHDSRPD